MADALRGADIVARTLDRAGLRSIFTLSGNHIMPIFDAMIGSGLRIVHVRHEAATVHMADAWGRLTGEAGIAMVTAGAGHANAAAALCTALAADSPLVLLSGHAETGELGRGGFQEMRQAYMAEPVTKASWTARSTATLGHELAEAVRIAKSGRPGPVHLSLPFDLVEATVADAPELWPDRAAFEGRAEPLGERAADAVLAALAAAERPLILAGPMLCDMPGRAALRKLEAATQAPAIGMESPRGVNDPSLGPFAEVLARADLIVLLGKKLDFTLRFGAPPSVDVGCRFVVIDADAALIDRAERETGDRLILSTAASARAAAGTLTRRASGARTDGGGRGAWLAQAREAVGYRPEAWASLRSRGEGRIHPVEMCRAIQPHLDANPDAVLVCDGGEIGQWAQAALKPARRVINGVAGAIGAATPFALAARRIEAKAPVMAVMGDGTFGFHMAEFDTAVRHGLPFVAVVGNDARWNAEYQIQVRAYGKQRAHGCELKPARYDLVVEALGGHGEHVTRAGDLPGALSRALASAKPACVNVMIEGAPAPNLRRGG